MPPRPTVARAYPPELAEYRQAVERSRLPYLALKFVPAKDTPPWASKLRGEPYWLKDTPFPTDPQGRPLILLAQINFAEAPELEGYPSRGILQLFISGNASQEQVWGLISYNEKPFDPGRWFASLHHQRFFRVVYHPIPTFDRSKLASAPRPWFGGFLPVMDEARIVYELKSEYVSPYDYRFQNVFGKPAQELFASFGEKEVDVADRYIGFAREWVPGKIGGYAYFVQSDPREAAPDNDWLLLLEMQSSGPPDGVEVLWGDVGVGGLFIRAADLARRDFSKVAYYWDNH